MTALAEDGVRRTGSGAGDKQVGAEGGTEVRWHETPLKTGALQDAIFSSANLSSIATDANGAIQIFNVGAPPYRTA